MQVTIISTLKSHLIISLWNCSRNIRVKYKGICVKFILILSWFEVVCKYNEKCHCLYSIVVFKYFSILSFMGKCAKVWYISTDHSRQYHTAHAPCMLHNYSYGHTLTICNDHCCWLHESTSSEL